MGEDLFLIGATQHDSTGTESWRSYLTAPCLQEAWSTPLDSPYAKFTKTTTIESIDRLGNHIKPRHSDAEKKSENELSQLIANPLFDKRTAVILDSGGSHSVAMAAKLATATGHQPIVMFNEVPHVMGLGSQAVQESATMLYHAREVEQQKNLALFPQIPRPYLCSIAIA